MKMGSAALAMAVAMTLMVGALLHGAEAQSTFCNTEKEPAPWADATALVNQLRLQEGQCCNSGGCKVVAGFGNAVASVCSNGDDVWCPNCSDVGNGLNVVLAQCNVANQVCGNYWPNVQNLQYFYLTNALDPAT